MYRGTSPESALKPIYISLIQFLRVRPPVAGSGLIRLAITFSEHFRPPPDLSSIVLVTSISHPFHHNTILVKAPNCNGYRDWINNNTSVVVKHHLLDFIGPGESNHNHAVTQTSNRRHPTSGCPRIIFCEM